MFETEMLEKQEDENDRVGNRDNIVGRKDYGRQA